MCVKSLVSMKKTEMKGVEKRSEIIYNTVVLKIKEKNFSFLHLIGENSCQNSLREPSVCPM